MTSVIRNPKSDKQKRVEQLAKQAQEKSESLRLARKIMEKMTKIRRTTSQSKTTVVYKRFQ